MRLEIFEYVIWWPNHDQEKSPGGGVKLFAVICDCSNKRTKLLFLIMPRYGGLWPTQYFSFTQQNFNINGPKPEIHSENAKFKL